MSYFMDHSKTEAELYTVGALLCVLDEVASDHLSQFDTPLCSGIINMIQVVAERVTKAQDLPAQNADDMLRKIMGYSINGDHTDLSDTDRAAQIWAEMRAMTAPRDGGSGA